MRRQPAGNAEADEAIGFPGRCSDECRSAIPISGSDDGREPRGARDLGFDRKA
jgi:hypothetical protein